MHRRDALRLLSATAIVAMVRPARPRRHAPVVPIEVAPGLSVWPREAWAFDRPPRWEMAPEEVQFLLVHHTASGNTYDEGGVGNVLRSTYDFHTGAQRGWPDVAYNFFVDRFGGVWEGRAGSLAGPVTVDATGGSQGFAQLVCLVGDFTSEMPSDPALESLTAMLAWLADRYAIDTTPGATTTFVSRGSNRWPAGERVVAATISGHRDMSYTACPGDTFYPYVRDELMARVTLRRQPPPPTPVPPLLEPPPTTLIDTTTSLPPPPTTLAPDPASAEPSTAIPAVTSSTAPGPATTAGGGAGSGVPRAGGAVPSSSAAAGAPSSPSAGTSAAATDGGGLGFPAVAATAAVIGAVGAGAALAAARRRRQPPAPAGPDGASDGRAEAGAGPEEP